jgi:transposase-like protein
MTTKYTPEASEAFYAALAETCIVTRACALAGLTRATVYRWRKERADFARGWDAALEVGVAALEDEVIRRAVHGVDEPLLHQGQFVAERDYDAIDPATDERYAPDLAPPLRRADGSVVYATIKRYSDQLLQFALKAHAPGRYRENVSLELAGRGGGPMPVSETARAHRIAVLMNLAVQHGAAEGLI